MALKDSKTRRSLTLVGEAPDLRFYTRQAAEVDGPLLVLGAANGRVAWALAAAGHKVIAVDPSERMVRSAEDRRLVETAENGARLNLQSADLRSLRLSERFALVLAPQHALGLMSSRADLEALFATVRHHLTPDGTFIYDLLNPQMTRVPPEDERAPGLAVEPPRPMFSSHLRERAVRGSPGAIRRLRLRHFRPEELDSALASSGMVTRERFGDFEGKAFDPEDPRQIGVAGLN